MRDLVRMTGLPRETIHFYLAQGLLQKARKTGRNTAVYGQEHLERLQRIKELQDRHFLPLRAIKAVLGEDAGGAFTDEQQAMLRRVRATLPADASPAAAPGVPVSTLVPAKVSKVDFDAMKRLGVVEVRGSGSSARLSAEDAELLECWMALRALESAGEARLQPEVLVTYDEAMKALVDAEAHTLAERFMDLPAESAARMIEQSEPLVIRVLQAMRRKQIAALLDRLAAGAPPPRGRK